MLRGTKVGSCDKVLKGKESQLVEGRGSDSCSSRGEPKRIPHEESSPFEGIH